MEKRSKRRKILDFEEFPLYADFFYNSLYDFCGHIQNISPNGLCIMLLNSPKKLPNNTRGTLHLIYLGRNRSIPATIKWMDTQQHHIRYAGIEVDPDLLTPILKEFFPDFYL